MEVDEERGEVEGLMVVKEGVVEGRIMPEVELEQQECTLQCVWDEVA